MAGKSSLANSLILTDKGVASTRHVPSWARLVGVHIDRPDGSNWRLVLARSSQDRRPAPIDELTDSQIDPVPVRRDGIRRNEN